MSGPAALLRALSRRVFRASLKMLPVLRPLAGRVPYSRWQPLMGTLFAGSEIVLWRGARLKIDPSQMHGYYIYFLDTYSDAEIEKVVEMCLPLRKGILADVGANTGFYAMVVAASCPDLTVHAFEPAPELCRVFDEHMTLNPSLRGRVLLSRVAVSASAGEVRFKLSDSPRNQETGRIDAGAEGKGVLVVPAVSLDEYFEKRGTSPDVVKIDVEGGELEVLRGMRRMMSKSAAPRLMIEVHPFYFEGPEKRRFCEDVHRELTSFGYDLSFLEQGHWVPLPPPDRWPGRLHVLALKGGAR